MNPKGLEYQVSGTSEIMSDRLSRLTCEAVPRPIGFPMVDLPGEVELWR